MISSSSKTITQQTSSSDPCFLTVTSESSIPNLTTTCESAFQELSQLKTLYDQWRIKHAEFLSTPLKESINSPIIKTMHTFQKILRVDRHQLKYSGEKQRCKEAFHQLLDVLTLYKNWNDPFSNTLFDCCADIVAADVDALVFDASVMQSIALKFKQLQGLLISQITHLPLVDPFLTENGVTINYWEQEKFESFIKGEPHYFVAAMIEWLDQHSFFEKFLEIPSQADALVISPPSPSPIIPMEALVLCSTEQKREVFQQLISDARLLQSLQHLTTQMKSASEDNQEFIEHLHTEVHHHTEILKETLRTQEAQTQSTISKIEEHFQEAVHTIEEAHQILKEENEESHKRLANAEASVSRQYSQLQNLLNENAALQRRVQEIASHKNKSICILM